MKAIHLIYIVIIIALIALFESCEYEYIEFAEQPVPPPPDTNDTIPVHQISFTLAIEPIFEEATCTNCHNGSLTPDLTEGNAYNSIMSNGLAVPFDHTNSMIYTYPHPVSGSHGTRYQNTAQTDSIYLWIYQGAIDN